jgi:hypothetical protein
MISGMREQVLALMCLRYGTVPHQGRGLDDLPPWRDRGYRRRAGRLGRSGQLWRAFGVATPAAAGRGPASLPAGSAVLIPARAILRYPEQAGG